MKLMFISKLGQEVRHPVKKIGSHVYETDTKSRLQFKIKDGTVFLIGGHSAFSLGHPPGWISGNFHSYYVLLGNHAVLS